MAAVENAPRQSSSGEWNSVIDAAFSRPLGVISPFLNPVKMASSGNQELAVSKNDPESSDCLTPRDEELEEESLEPLKMPLDISNAPSLALPDNFSPLEAPQNEQRQAEMLLATTFADQRNTVGQPGIANGVLGAATPKGGPQTHQHQQQHILRPHRGPQLDYWQPQASDSQLLLGDPAQQVAQWQLQQQWQQQQPPLMHNGGRVVDYSPLSHNVGRGAPVGSPGSLHADVHHLKSPRGEYGGPAGTLAGYAPRQSVVSIRKLDTPVVDAGNGPPGGLGSSTILSGSPHHFQSWMEPLASAPMSWNSASAPGMLGALEQAAAAAGSPVISSYLSSAAISPRSTEYGAQVSPPRFGGPPPAAGGHYGEGARIYVGGIPDLVSVNMVRSHFSRWGQVEDVYFPKERATRRRRPFCFVTFESHHAAECAVAESNRVIEGYPVASITVPTERSTHYGLRPPPTGAATPAAAGLSYVTDSALIQARSAQIAHQAQQQQQAVVTQLAAAGVDTSLLLGLHSDSSCAPGGGHPDQRYLSMNGGMDLRDMQSTGYTGSNAGSQRLRGGDTSEGTSYTSTPEMRRFMPVDSNGMPIGLVPSTGQHHVDAHLEHSPRASSPGSGEAARMAAMNSVNGGGDRNGFMRGQHCSSQAAAGGMYAPTRSFTSEDGEAVLRRNSYGSYGSHGALGGLHSLSADSGAGAGHYLHDALGGGGGQYGNAYAAPYRGSLDFTGSMQKVVSPFGAAQLSGDGAEFGGFTGSGLGTSPAGTDQWGQHHTAGGCSGAQSNMFAQCGDYESGHSTPPEMWVGGDRQLPGNILDTFNSEGMWGSAQPQGSFHKGAGEVRQLSEGSLVDAFRTVHLTDLGAHAVGGDGVSSIADPRSAQGGSINTSPVHGRASHIRSTQSRSHSFDGVHGPPHSNPGR